MEDVLDELSMSVVANINNKVVDIIFLYAGSARTSARTELNICQKLLEKQFKIENVYLHDIVYADDNANSIELMQVNN